MCGLSPYQPRLGQDVRPNGIDPGDVDQVVYGSLGSEILEEVLANPDHYGALITEKDPSARGPLTQRVITCGNCRLRLSADNVMT